MQIPMVYHNGEWLPASGVKIPFLDRSYLYGEGVFESIRAVQGKIPLIREHWDRFLNSAIQLNLPLRLQFDSFQSILRGTLSKNNLKEASLRVNFSRNNADMNSMEASTETNLLVWARTLPASEDLFFAPPCRVGFSDFRLSPDVFTSIKTTNYLRSLAAMQAAKRLGLDELLFLNTAGRIAEGARSNFFIFHRNEWFTPPISEGALNGVMRALLLKCAPAFGISIREQALELEMLTQAQEIILTNAVRGIIPVTEIDDFRWKKSEVGIETQKLAKCLSREIQNRINR